MTSSNGSIFRVTGPLRGEFTGHRCMDSPHKGQWRGALMFSLILRLNKGLSKQSRHRWFEAPSHSLWRHCDVAKNQHYIFVCPSFQVQGEGTVPGAAPKYRGMLSTIATIAREEGPRALYNGLSPGLQRQVAFCTVRIGFYDSVKQTYIGFFQKGERCGAKCML